MHAMSASATKVVRLDVTLFIVRLEGLGAINTTHVVNVRVR